jgi:hypothetical protein
MTLFELLADLGLSVALVALTIAGVLALADLFFG